MALPRSLLNAMLPLCLVASSVAACAASTKPAATEPALDADATYRVAFHWLSAGRQSDAERIVTEATQLFDQDPRLLFFAAALSRSRFEVEEATPKFNRVIAVDPDGTYGEASRFMVALDARRNDASHDFAAFQKFVEKHNDDPLILWMAGVQCRALNKNNEGIKYYERLLKQLEVGPVLVHQTYANLLDEVGRSADAVPHREAAIKMSPAGWSYNGYANTLNRLKRFAEADAAYAKAIELTPSNVLYWENWAKSMRDRGSYEGAVEKCKEGIALFPEVVQLWNLWGDIERHFSHPRLALEKYQRAMQLRPKAWWSYKQSAEIYEELGDHERAEALRKKLASMGVPASQPSTTRSTK